MISLNIYIPRMFFLDDFFQIEFLCHFRIKETSHHPYKFIMKPGNFRGGTIYNINVSFNHTHTHVYQNYYLYIIRNFFFIIVCPNYN